MPKAGVTSCVFDAGDVGLFAGDTRGNVCFFPPHVPVPLPSNVLPSVPPASVLRNLHGIMHVTALSYDSLSSSLLSIGHDGHLQTSFLSLESSDLSPCFHVTMPFGKVLTTLILTADGPAATVVVGGYHAGTFYLFDVTNSYQLLQVECGGWKRPHDFAFEGSSLTAIAVANNDGGAVGPVLSLSNLAAKAAKKPAGGCHLNFGTPFHGRTT